MADQKLLTSVRLSDATTPSQQQTVDASGNAYVKVNAAIPTGSNVIGAVSQSGTWTVTSNSAGVGTIATGQVSVANTATSIVAARSGRRQLTIVNAGTIDVYLGTSGVTTTTGQLLLGVKGAAITMELGNVAIYGIVASGSQTVTFCEEF